MTASAVVHTALTTSATAGRELGSHIATAFAGERPDALILFASPQHDYAELLQAIETSCRPRLVVGCSSTGAFTTMARDANSACAIALRSDDMRFAAGIGRGLRADRASVARELVASFHGVADHEYPYRAALVLTDALAGHAEELVEHLNVLTAGQYQLFGGGASDEATFHATHVFLGGDGVTDAVVALEILSRKPLGIGVGHGWQPAGPEMRVTEADGLRLVSLNAIPVTEVFEDYAETTGQTFDADNPGAFFLHNVLGIHTDDGHKLRVPLAINPDGSVSCSAEVPPGATVRIMKVSPDATEAAARATHTALQGLDGQRPEVALLFECVATQARMGQTPRAFCTRSETSSRRPGMRASTRLGNSCARTASLVASIRAAPSSASFRHRKLAGRCVTPKPPRPWPLSRSSPTRMAGADDLIVFVADPALDLLLPAPGFPQTLPRGRQWREFLSACRAMGPACRHTADLPYERADTLRRAAGIAAADGSVLVLLDGTPCPDAVAAALPLLPLLAATFRGERGTLAATGQAHIASETAARATALTESLDAARRDLQRALTEADAARRRADALSAARDTALECIITMDHEGRVIEFNPAAERTFGYSHAEALGQELGALIVPPSVREAHRRGVARYLETGEATMLGTRIELTGMRADGSEFPLEMAITRIPMDGPPVFTGFLHDISDRKQAEAALAHQALHDALTDLPNRALLHDRLDRAIVGARCEGTPLALLLLDLDRFKEVNDTFGHYHGDLLLREVAGRLRAAVRHSDTVARLGGDEFAVLLPRGDEAAALLVARTIRETLEAPVVVEGQMVQVGASIGIALCPAHGTDAQTLLRHADVAMYMAKRARSGCAVYAAAQDQHSPDRLARLTDLSDAIADGALAVHYQPLITMRDGRHGLEGSRAYAVEALVRWPHPRHGLIPPDLFIPLAEQTGLITPLTRWVLATAVGQCDRWRRAGLDLGVAVNISTWDLHDHTFPEYVTALLQAHGVPPDRLRLELTESVIMADTPRTLEALTRLAAFGIGISVDDFGTGYSSLSYLKRLPVDMLKIDRSFVQHMAEDDADASIVRSTISLAHALGLRVVAEGVEDQRTWDALAAMECDTAQGYYISRPLPPDAIERWVRTAPLAAAV